MELKENIGAKACLPVRCAVISSKERVAMWQEPGVAEMLLSTGKEHTRNVPTVNATIIYVAGSAQLPISPWDPVNQRRFSDG